MKVLIYSHAFAPSIGGVETHVMLLAQGLAEQYRSHDRGELQVTVVTPLPASRTQDSALPFRVLRAPSKTALARLIRDADLVHLAGPSFWPMMLGLVFRKPVTVEHHGYPPICPNGLLVYEPDKTVCPGHFMQRRYLQCLRCNAEEGWGKSALKLLATFPRRWMTKRVAANLCVTSHVLHRLELPRTQVIYHGIRDVETNMRSAGPSASAFCFAYVGRLVALKGLPILVDAADKLKRDGYRFVLKFIGDGPERASLEKLVRERGLDTETTFTGNAIGPVLQELLEQVDAVVMPSVWEETAGLSAIEQMMRGKLVIASDIGGLGEVVGDAGLRFPAGSSQALAACMRHALDHPDLAMQLGATARQRALSVFHFDQMVQQHVSRWTELERQGETAGAR